jgi:hypothetical protein
VAASSSGCRGLRVERGRAYRGEPQRRGIGKKEEERKMRKMGKRGRGGE